MKLPNVFEIIIIIFVTYLNFIIYQLWSEPQKILKRSEKQIYKLPNWFPLRGLALAIIEDDKVWITLDRIICILAEIFCIGILALDIIEWFSGQ